MKLAIHGCYAGGNFGDILIHDLIRQYVEREFEVHVVCPWLKYADNGRTRRSGKGWYDVVTANAAVFGGGGYFNGSGRAAKRRVSRRYLLPARTWSVLKTPYIVLGVGVGPPLSDDVGGPVRTICEGADRVTVRDDESRKLLEKIGVSREDITVTCDVVMSLTDEHIPGTAQQIATEDLGDPGNGIRYLGLHFPNFYGPRCLIGEPPFHARRPDPRLTRVLSQVASVLKKHEDIQPVWINTGSSGSFLYALKRICRDTLPCLKILPYRDHWVTASTLGRLDGVITSMLHVGVTAWSLGVPCCCFATHGKSQRFYRQIGRLKYFSEASDAISPIRSWTEDFVNDPVAFAAEDVEARQRLPRLARTNFQILGEWLRGIDGCRASC